jgi:serine/threonine protein phosphatase 1
VLSLRTVSRIIAISDIHGQNIKLLQLLEKTGYQPDKDLLVLCGDLIDRGQENVDTLTTCGELRRKGAILLKGNHEQFLEQSLAEMIIGDGWRSQPSQGLSNWVNHNGGAQMYHEIKELSQSKLIQILNFVQNLRIYFINGKFIFTHAGANCKKTLEENSENDVVWMDRRFPYAPAYKDKILIFGHIPTWKLCPDGEKFKNNNAKIWYDRIHKDKIDIDCGSIYGGRLAALVLPSYEEVYI